MTKTIIPFYQADAFTDQPFKGNPAAICFLKKSLPDETLQAIAAENFLPETAFILPLEKGYSLRWFSPEVEIPLCGHATLATAHVMWSEGMAPENEALHFHTLSGELIVTKESEWLHLNFPAFTEKTIESNSLLEEAIGLKIKHLCQMHHFILLELENANDIPSIQPKMEILKNFDPVIVTAKAQDDSPYDFISRVFGPSIGIPEDPVTGSAHCCLGPYWASRISKTKMLAFQASSRGGEVKVEIKGDRVQLSGKAITVIKGTLLL
jgi:PhzF family phenazine biosynthesis protein